MTDFERIKNYYSHFDEKNRLKASGSGRLEYAVTMDVIRRYLPEQGTILDLGGGAGAYAFPLSEAGYRVFLADLSDVLVEQARQQAFESGNGNISCDVANATDLSMYEDGQFDAVLLLGPLYHLLEETERQKCVSEVRRVLKPGGVVIAAFLPYLSGSVGVVERIFGHPDQVGEDNLREVFRTGRFRNLRDAGFQEGYYPRPEEIEELFGKNGFEKTLVRSVRGFGWGREEYIFRLQERDPALFSAVMELLNETAGEKAIVETCGHALYAGTKRGWQKE